MRRVNKGTLLGCIGDHSGTGAVVIPMYNLAVGVGQYGGRCRTGGEEFGVGWAACFGWMVVGLPMVPVGGCRQGVVAWSWGHRYECWHYLV